MDAPTVVAIGSESLSRDGSPRRPSRWVARGIVLVAAGAAVVGVVAVVTTHESRTAPLNPPSDTLAEPTPVTVREPGTVPASAPTPAILEEPSSEEASLARSIISLGTGPTEITTNRNVVSLRSSGEDRWAYSTGTDGEALQFGLLGVARSLELSVLDDRLFVASAPASPQDPGSPPLAWLIDSVTGERGALTWQDEPSLLNSSVQGLVLFDEPSTYFPDESARFLPRVVDTAAGTIRPLAVPADASAAMPIAQLGSGRIWIGIAPDGGDLGLAYTDDGGTTWTHVALPDEMRTATQQLDVDSSGEPSVIAAAGDHVAVTGGPPGEGRIFVSSDAGKLWQVATPSSPTGDATAVAPLTNISPENGTWLFVLSDNRLVISFTTDPYSQRLFVSASATDWTHVEEWEPPTGGRFFFGVDQAGVAVIFRGAAGPMQRYTFSTDLVDWWKVPNIE